MPIELKEYSWRQTEEIIVITVPLQGMNPCNVDIFISQCFVKLHEPPFIFELFLKYPVDYCRSCVRFTATEAIIELYKRECGIWDCLEADFNRCQKLEIKINAINEAHVRSEQRREDRRKLRNDQERFSVSQAIEQDSQRRSVRQEQRDKERETTMKEFEDWRLSTEQQNMLNPNEECTLSTLKVQVNDESDIIVENQIHDETAYNRQFTEEVVEINFEGDEMWITNLTDVSDKDVDTVLEEAKKDKCAQYLDLDVNANGRVDILTPLQYPPDDFHAVDRMNAYAKYATNYAPQYSSTRPYDRVQQPTAISRSIPEIKVADYDEVAAGYAPQYPSTEAYDRVEQPTAFSRSISEVKATDYDEVAAGYAPQYPSTEAYDRVEQQTAFSRSISEVKATDYDEVAAGYAPQYPSTEAYDRVQQPTAISRSIPEIKVADYDEVAAGYAPQYPSTEAYDRVEQPTAFSRSISEVKATDYDEVAAGYAPQYPSTEAYDRVEQPTAFSRSISEVKATDYDEVAAGYAPQYPSTEAYDRVEQPTAFSRSISEVKATDYDEVAAGYVPQYPSTEAYDRVEQPTAFSRSISEVKATDYDEVAAGYVPQYPSTEAYDRVEQPTAFSRSISEVKATDYDEVAAGYVPQYPSTEAYDRVEQPTAFSRSISEVKATDYDEVAAGYVPQYPSTEAYDRVEQPTAFSRSISEVKATDYDEVAAGYVPQYPSTEAYDRVEQPTAFSRSISEVKATDYDEVAAGYVPQYPSTEAYDRVEQPTAFSRSISEVKATDYDEVAAGYVPQYPSTEAYDRVEQPTAFSRSISEVKATDYDEVAAGYAPQYPSTEAYDRVEQPTAFSRSISEVKATDYDEVAADYAQMDVSQIISPIQGSVPQITVTDYDKEPGVESSTGDYGFSSPYSGNIPTIVVTDYDSQRQSKSKYLDVISEEEEGSDMQEAEVGGMVDKYLGVKGQTSEKSFHTANDMDFSKYSEFFRTPEDQDELQPQAEQNVAPEDLADNAEEEHEQGSYLENKQDSICHVEDVKEYDVNREGNVIETFANEEVYSNVPHSTPICHQLGVEFIIDEHGCRTNQRVSRFTDCSDDVARRFFNDANTFGPTTGYSVGEVYVENAVDDDYYDFDPNLDQFQADCIAGEQDVADICIENYLQNEGELPMFSSGNSRMPATDISIDNNPSDNSGPNGGKLEGMLKQQQNLLQEHIETTEKKLDELHRKIDKCCGKLHQENNLKASSGNSLNHKRSISWQSRTISEKSSNYLNPNEKKKSFQVGSMSEKRGSLQVDSMSEKRGSLQAGSMSEKRGSLQSGSMSEKRGSLQAGSMSEKRGSLQAGSMSEKRGSLQAGSMSEKRGSLQVYSMSEKRGSLQVDSMSEKRGSLQVDSMSENRGSLQVDSMSENRGSLQVDSMSENRGSLQVDSMSENRGSLQVDSMSENRGSLQVDSMSENRGSLQVDSMSENRGSLQVDKMSEKRRSLHKQKSVKANTLMVRGEKIFNKNVTDKKSAAKVSPRRSSNQKKNIPPPRQTETLNIFFTERSFPTPKRESCMQLEQCWLENVNACKRATGFCCEDLRPEEQDPYWCKNKGDEFYKCGNHLGAISAYSHGINICNNIATLFSNRAACHLALGNYNSCIQDCTSALDLLKPACPSNSDTRAKCIARRAMALTRVGMLSKGIDEMRAAICLKPDNSQLKDDLYRMEKAWEQNPDSD